MRHTILILALALATGTTQARADMVYYNMSGTVTAADFFWAPSATPPPPPVAKGDHITWTLQYDRTTLPSASSPRSYNYTLSSPPIMNIVDQTNGITMTSYRYDPFSPSKSTLSLSNYPGSLEISTNGGDGYGYGSYETALDLSYKGSFPSLNLANLQLNSLPLNLKPYSNTLSFSYGDQILGFDFEASVNSISAPVSGVPEPGSFSLFLLGAAGLATHGIRRRLRFRLVSFLAFADAG